MMVQIPAPSFLEQKIIMSC